MFLYKGRAKCNNISEITSVTQMFLIFLKINIYLNIGSTEVREKNDPFKCYEEIKSEQDQILC